MTIKIYGEHLSQPTRAVLLFCKLNEIYYEVIKIEIFKLQQQFSPEYKGRERWLCRLDERELQFRSLHGLCNEVEKMDKGLHTVLSAINPFGKIPTLVDGSFKLFESHAILIYLASAFPGVPDHWYPADLSKRAEINSVLDWHHQNTRYCTDIVRHSAIFPAYGYPSSPREAAKAEKIVIRSLAQIESFWLKESGRFLLGRMQPSIADLSLVCEIMALEILDEEDRDRILSPHKKVLRWITDTKNATQPHFDEVHAAQCEAKERFRNMRAERATSKADLGRKANPHSKM